MSRSYGKPHTPFHLVHMDEIEELKKDTYHFHLNWNYAHNFNSKLHRWFETWDDLNYAKWRYKTKKHTCHRHSHRFPKSYRKFVNSTRKTVDKRELYKELNYDEYSPVYSKWNCKDSDPWWFW